MKCYFKTKGNRFILGNHFIERIWEYNNGNLYTVSLINKQSTVDLINRAHDENQYEQRDMATTEFSYEGLTCHYMKKEEPYFMDLIDVQVSKVTDSLYSMPYLELVFVLKDSVHGVDIKRHAIIYENASAIRTYNEVSTVNFPMGEFHNVLKSNVLDYYPIKYKLGKNYMLSCEFFTRTDGTNHLVEERIDPEGFDKGNLIIYTDYNEEDHVSNNTNCTDANGFFILKESPCFTDERPEVEGNFNIGPEGIKSLGWGIRPEEFKLNEYIKTYSSVIGVFNGDRNNGLLAIKQYARERAKINPEKDYMIMANPWGDRHCLEHMGEEFVIKELEACAKLGATHYQLDDGWQKRGSLIRITSNEAIEDDYWDINPERFPNKFENVAQKAKELNVKIALWFAPNTNKLFKNYKQEADLLLSMYKNYGIKEFKIDAVNLRCKEAEENLEKLFIMLKKESKGDISFNLDTTANARAGYFMFQEYGNIFLENRYTDWGNYYPWLTLKNLWDLSAYVPTQKLQIEFLNLERNNDILAPQNYSNEYVFAITMFANPLCWFEPSALSSKTLERYRNIISFYKKYRDNIFEGHIFPIGDRPSGYSWTGLQSHNPLTNKGFMIIFREYNKERAKIIKPLFMQGYDIKMRGLYHAEYNQNNSDEFTQIDNYQGEGIEITLEKQNSFQLYEYILE